MCLGFCLCIQIHGVTKPETGGKDLDTSVVKLNHYRGLNTYIIESCIQFIHDNDWIPKSWLRDFSISRAAVRIRHQAMKEALKSVASRFNETLEKTLVSEGPKALPLWLSLGNATLGDDVSRDSEEDVKSFRGLGQTI